MRVAIAVALAIGLCVGCGGPEQPPQGACFSAPVGTDGQVTIGVGTGAPSMNAQYDCSEIRPNWINCVAQVDGDTWSIELRDWTAVESSLATVTYSPADAPFPTIAESMGGISKRRGTGDVGNRRAWIVTGLTCGKDPVSGQWTAASLNKASLLMPLGY